MYDHTYRKLVEAGVDKRLLHPIWMSREGKECAQKDTLGCIVSHESYHPDRCFVGDEVGRNLSMKGGGHADGKLLLTLNGSVPYDKSSSTEKKFTMIGLTALDGMPVLCLLTIQDINRDLSV